MGGDFTVAGGHFEAGPGEAGGAVDPAGGVRGGPAAGARRRCEGPGRRPSGRCWGTGRGRTPSPFRWFRGFRLASAPAAGCPRLAVGRTVPSRVALTVTPSTLGAPYMDRSPEILMKTGNRSGAEAGGVAGHEPGEVTPVRVTGFVQRSRHEVPGPAAGGDDDVLEGPGPSAGGDEHAVVGFLDAVDRGVGQDGGAVGLCCGDCGRDGRSVRRAPPWGSKTPTSSGRRLCCG